jgi:hypothetical protein
MRGANGSVDSATGGLARRILLEANESLKPWVTNKKGTDIVCGGFFNYHTLQVHACHS